MRPDRTPPPLRPASAPAEAVLATLVARLSPSELTRATLGPVPADLAKDSSPSHPTDRWVYLTSTAKTAEAQTRAHWQASLVVADLWRLRGGAAADNPIRGGALTQPDGPDGGSNNASFGISRLQPSLMFTDSAGKPSRLVMSRAVIEAGVRAATAAAHLRVTDFRYTTLVGTVLEVRAVTDDPFALLRSGGGALPDVDTSQLEGVMETIVDSGGNLVRSYTQATGFQEGSIGYGEKYAAFAATLPNPGYAGGIGPTQPLTAPAPAPRTN